MEKLRTQAQENTTRGKIINAILAGCHTTEAIIKNAGLFTQYSDFCDEIVKLRREGLITSDCDDVWSRWGYYFTEKALRNI